MTLVAEVQDLCVTGRRNGTSTTIVERVSFDLRAGETCGVVGETGAGKTLMVKALLGILPRGVSASGLVRIGDGDLVDVTLDADTRARTLAGDTAVVLQNPAGMLDPLVRLGRQLTEEVLWHGTMGKREAAAQAEQLLTAMGFSDPAAIMKLFPHQLSGGMAQRAAIAMALMPRPRVLVVDEPTSALDAHLRVEVLRLLQRAAREQDAAVIIVSHDLPLVTRFCDTTLVMYAGRIVERGPTDRVLTAPEHPYTRALLHSASTLDSSPRQPLETIPGTPPRPGDWPAGCVFEARCRHAFARCRGERPDLRSDGKRAAACHLAFEREHA